MRDGPDGKPFTWGKIVEIHKVGTIEIVEFTPAFLLGNAGNQFHVFVDGANTNRGARTLDGALLVGLAEKYDGRNSNAAEWMARIINFKEG
jgi:hypothetical protein